MSKLSFIDKLRILLDISKSSSLCIFILALLIFVGIIFITTNKKNAKRNKMIYASISVFILVTLVVAYHASLSNMLKYMMDNFFIVVYFPNLAIYLAALIATNIILWISLFNYKTTKSIKTLNVSVYIIMNYLLALLLNIVNKNNLDIFTQKSVYGNKNATALIELSSIIFIVWIIFLVIYKIILIYIRKDYQPKVKKILIKKKVKKLPENFAPLETPTYIYGRAPKMPVKVVEKEVIVTEPVRVNVEKDENLQDFDSMLTLDDYKTVLKMLKSQKDKMKQEEVIRQELQEEQNKYKELLDKQRNNEQKKYEELLSLYR